MVMLFESMKWKFFIKRENTGIIKNWKSSSIPLIVLSIQYDILQCQQQKNWCTSKLPDPPELNSCTLCNKLKYKKWKKKITLSLNNSYLSDRTVDEYVEEIFLNQLFQFLQYFLQLHCTCTWTFFCLFIQSLKSGW